ncbi:MAG: hypothetical protein ACLPX7_21635, partial [Xanthobacteraceae bacterium]
NSLAIDAHMTLSGQPAANALIPTRPEFAINVKGPLAAPERQLDVSTLVAWLTLRAAELQTRRLELIEANRRDEVVGAIARPASPAIRFIPMGTALETRDHANALLGATLGARSFDRLHPEGSATMPTAAASPPSAISRQQPGADNTTATGSTAESLRGRPKAPPPAIHSPLDLLFGSQN